MVKVKSALFFNTLRPCLKYFSGQKLISSRPGLLIAQRRMLLRPSALQRVGTLSHLIPLYDLHLCALFFVNWNSPVKRRCVKGRARPRSTFNAIDTSNGNLQLQPLCLMLVWKQTYLVTWEEESDAQLIARNLALVISPQRINLRRPRALSNPSDIYSCFGHSLNFFSQRKARLAHIAQSSS